MEKNYDVILMQETHCTKSKRRFWKAETRGDMYFSDGESNARGVATWIRKELKFEMKKQINDAEGRVLHLYGEMDGNELLISNVYAPNEDRPDFFEPILEEVLQADVEFKFLGGDLNLVLNPEIDRKTKAKTVRSKALEKVRDYLEEYDWIDIWREINPGAKQYTWFRRKPNVFSRLDYFLTPLSSLGYIQDCQIVHNSLSDHSFVMMEIAWESLCYVKFYAYMY